MIEILNLVKETQQEAQKIIDNALIQSEKIKKDLVSYQEKIDGYFDDFSPIKWTRKDNLHITMFFVGFVESMYKY